jgi:tetratricopeptide (TPR) repeat protein
MPRFKRRYVWALGCFSALAGCAQLYSGNDYSRMNISPVMRVEQADLSADRLYNLGRYHHRRIEYLDAIAAYEQALALDPEYIEAHNGLGIVYALLKRHELSLQHFRKAVSLAPIATYLHSNIGYAFQLQNRYSEALEAYQEALRLDPDNHKARKNVANLSQQLGLAASEITVLVIDEPGEAVAANVQKMSEPSGQTGSQLVQVASNVYEFRNNAEVSKIDAVIDLPPKHPASASEIITLNQKQRIEVSNGNGITGMARKVARFLEQSGFSGARLTNHDNFNQAETVIHYRPGQQAQAEQMRKLMPNEAARSIENNRLRDDIGVKILLGQDLNVAVDHFNAPLADQLALNQ